MSEARSVSPAWMKGIKQGEWQQVSKAQLKSKQRPCYALKTRVWATLVLHSAGYQGERAVKLKAGKPVPLSIGDIATELHRAAVAFYKDAAITPAQESREQIRRAIVDLEDDGLCERRIDGQPVQKMRSINELRKVAAGDIEIYCWLLPKDPSVARVLAQYKEATIKGQSDAPQLSFQFSLPQIFRALKIPLDKSKLSDPAYFEAAERAFRAARAEFLKIFSESTEVNTDSVTVPSPFDGLKKMGGVGPQKNGGLPPTGKGASTLLPEKIVEKIPPPPTSSTGTERRRREYEYPQTLAELRKKDPATKEAFVIRLARETAPHLRQTLTDDVLLALCKESFRTGPRDHGVGLLLSRVPTIASTWRENLPSAVCGICRQPITPGQKVIRDQDGPYIEHEACWREKTA